MRYYLSRDTALKQIEFPAAYHMRNDELYEVDQAGFRFLQECAGQGGRPGMDDDDFVGFCVAEGLIGTDCPAGRMPPVSQSPLPSLRYLELQITNACSLKCRHCYVCRSPGRELTSGQVRAVLSEFQEMQGLRLMVTGGEPLVHSQFWEINDLLPEFAFRKILFTNGMLLSKGLLRSLNFHEIQISIDGMQKGHDYLRGTGSYEAVMKHVREALSSGMQVSVATMVHRENLDEFGEMEDLFRGLGVRDWTVDVPSPAGSSGEHCVWRLSPEVAGPYMRYGFGAGLHGDGEGHACGLHLAAVLPDGAVARCGFYGDEPLGSIAGGLANAWKARVPLRLDELECALQGCPVLDACRGGCRFRAFRSSESRAFCGSGYGRSRDLFKCHAYGIIKT